jgi:hypothetical protein
MAIPYIGTWDNSPPGSVTTPGVGWSNVPPVPMPPNTDIGSGFLNNPPVAALLPSRVPSNLPPIARPYAPSGITQDVGYILLSTGATDKVILSQGGFLVLAGSPGQFSNLPPEVGTVPGSVGWSNASPVARANVFPPFDGNAPGAAATPFPPANNTAPGANPVPPGQGPSNNQPPINIPLPNATNDAPPVPI